MKGVGILFAAALFLTACGGNDAAVKTDGPMNIVTNRAGFDPFIDQTVTAVVIKSELILPDPSLPYPSDIKKPDPKKNEPVPSKVPGAKESDPFIYACYYELPDHYQFVVFSKEIIPCSGKVKVTGKVGALDLLLKGGTHYKDYYIIADKWECAE